MRRQLTLVSAIVLLDTSFYAAIAPLLPFYAEEHDLTKTSAGVLAAAYPAGTMLAALPAGALGARVGAKRMLGVGLGLLAVSSFTFGVAGDIVLLDLARFVQGIGGAISFASGMAWLSATAPPERRAQVLGTALGAAVAGALLGPVLGALGRATGPAPTFIGVAALALLLLALVLRERIPPAARAPDAGGLRAALRHPLITKGAWFIGCGSLFFGVLDVLLPLRLEEVGAAAWVIAGVFLAGAAIEAVNSPLVGRYADRRGWLGTARFGLLGVAAISLIASLPDSTVPLAVVGIIAAPIAGVLWIPGMALLSEGSDRAALDHTYAFAVMNLIWAATGAVGAGVGGALARATSDFVPYAFVAGIVLVTLAVATGRTRHESPASA